MKNRTFLAACVGAVTLGAVLGFMPADQNMTKANGQTVVNTTQISRKVRGLNGPTPVKIYIHKDKIYGGGGGNVYSLFAICCPYYCVMFLQDKSHQNEIAVVVFCYEYCLHRLIF